MSIPKARFPRVAEDPTQMGWRSKFKQPASSRALNKVAATLFAVIAVIILAGAGWSAYWSASTSQPLGVGLALILLGFSASMLYEARAVWPGSSHKTISQFANGAFLTHQSTWVGIYLGIVVVVGLLTMHFTRVAQNQHADWVFLATTILVLVNGALIAYWFEWLP
jgi:hypothetical protein